MNSVQSNKPIIFWLFINCLMIIAMVIIGGITRLTESGLSMVDWNLFSGVIPPLNEDQWQKLFEMYKLYPEYNLINYDMNLSEFKSIYFWEYFHRIWGRLIGLTFFVPFLYFLIIRKISKKLLTFLSIALSLGIFQAFMGWYMVKSGLIDKPDVSQYRLAAHLSTAFLIYVILLFLTWNQYRVGYNLTNKNFKTSYLKFGTCFSLTLLTIISGAFVAGTNAGLAYSNFPLMGDTFLPPDPFSLNPLWKNFFENISLVQFDHRLLATITALTIFFVCLSSKKMYFGTIIDKFLNVLICLILIQYSLGILTLKFHIPISLGVIHQLGSMLVLSIITIIISEFYTVKKGVIK